MSKARAINDAIVDALGASAVEFSMESTPNVSGALEVTVNGKMVHSKLQGDGYVNTRTKMDKIVKAVSDAIAA